MVTNTTESGAARLTLRRLTLPALTDVSPSALLHTERVGPARHPHHPFASAAPVPGPPEVRPR